MSFFFLFEYVSTIVAVEKIEMSSSSDDESSNSLCRSDLEALMASSVEGLLRGVYILLGGACRILVCACG